MAFPFLASNISKGFERYILNNAVQYGVQVLTITELVEPKSFQKTKSGRP